MKIHKRFSITFTFVMILSLLLVGNVGAKSPNKVDICHNNGDGTFALVKIKVDTLQTHLAHGDAMPGEAVPGRAGMVFGTNCALVSTAPNQQAPVVNPPSKMNPSTSKQGKKTGKVDVCHRRGNETFILINISGNALPAHLAHGDGLPNGLVPGQPNTKFGADCSITHQKELVETLTVPATAEVPVSSMALANGQLYEFKAIGTYIFATPNAWADAEWLWNGNQVIKGDDWPPHPPNVLDLTINGCSNNTDWGDYQPTHVYTMPWTGTGVPLTFTICDTSYIDNAGFLTVEIWKINW